MDGWTPRPRTSATIGVRGSEPAFDHRSHRVDAKAAGERDERGPGVCYGWQILAYCLMGNHYHLIVRIGDAGLRSGMRDLNSAYCQAFNRRRGIVGHVLQGRYKSPLVEEDGYLAALARYVVRNPVRTGWCAHPAGWEWSSYRATVESAQTR